MLTDAKIDSVGSGTKALHIHYMKACVERIHNLAIELKHRHLLRSSDKECFTVGFNDLYDLFNLDALDVSLLRCFTL